MEISRPKIILNFDQCVTFLKSEKCQKMQSFKNDFFQEILKSSVHVQEFLFPKPTKYFTKYLSSPLKCQIKPAVLSITASPAFLRPSLGAVMTKSRPFIGHSKPITPSYWSIYLTRSTSPTDRGWWMKKYLIKFELYKRAGLFKTTFRNYAQIWADFFWKTGICDRNMFTVKNDFGWHLNFVH